MGIKWENLLLLGFKFGKDINIVCSLDQASQDDASAGKEVILVLQSQLKVRWIKCL